jgi:hypothetical protein
MRWQIRPLGPWLGPVTGDRKSSGVFKASWDDTLTLLGNEMEALGGDGAAIVQIDVQAFDVRADGMLKSRAQVGNFPGVVVSFDSRHGPLRYATDAYEQQWSGSPPGWQANVRAIALSLVSLRAVDRYGVSKSGEQYRGWTALAAAKPGQGPFTTRADAESWMLKCAAESGISMWQGWDGLYKALAKVMHPDNKQTGNADLWDRLDAAVKLLGVRKNGGTGA